MTIGCKFVLTKKQFFVVRRYVETEIERPKMEEKLKVKWATKQLSYRM